MFIRAGMMKMNQMPDKVYVGPVHLDIEVSVHPFLRRTELSKPRRIVKCCKKLNVAKSQDDQPACEESQECEKAHG